MVLTELKVMKPIRMGTIGLLIFFVCLCGERWSNNPTPPVLTPEQAPSHEKECNPPPRQPLPDIENLAEAEIKHLLATPETDDNLRVRLIESLGRFKTSHSAVAELIYWLQFTNRQSTFDANKVHANNESVAPVYPAEKSLNRIGPFAVPQLVEEYILFYENTSIEAGQRRYASLLYDAQGNVRKVQDYSHRCLSIEVVLISSPEMLSCSLECAWNLMAARPDDDRVHRGCRELCRAFEQCHWKERTQAYKSFSQNADGTILTPERRTLAILLDEFVEDDDRARLIARLPLYKGSPLVISELVHWLEFQPGGPYSKIQHDPHPRKIELHPAARALTHFGPDAVSQLVGDYLYYFENTDLMNNRKRMYVWEAKIAPGVPFEKQDPSPRLKLIATVLAQSPETARKAVDYAIKRSGAPAADACMQRGCRALIDEIVGQFPKADRPDIFPQSVLGR